MCVSVCLCVLAGPGSTHWISLETEVAGPDFGSEVHLAKEGKKSKSGHEHKEHIFLKNLGPCRKWIS